MYQRLQHFAPTVVALQYSSCAIALLRAVVVALYCLKGWQKRLAQLSPEKNGGSIKESLITLAAIAVALFPFQNVAQSLHSSQVDALGCMSPGDAQTSREQKFR